MTLITETLYKEIIKIIPIACVDLFVVNQHKEILLLKRNNEPAFEQWWFPGGRVHFGETRIDAAKRKLKEECGLEVIKMTEYGTYDLMLTFTNDSEWHAITTLFVVSLKSQNVVLDSQSKSFKWNSPTNWNSEVLHPFVKSIFEKYVHEQQRNK